MLEDIKPKGERPSTWPAGPTSEEWTDPLAGVAIRGSTDVRTRLTVYYDLVLKFYGQLGQYIGLLFAQEEPTYQERADELIPDARQRLDPLREAVIAALDAVEQAMREELATI